jgi:hypothetical protein
MKKIWITSLMHDEKNIQNLMLRLKPYQVQVDGQFWVDDLGKMAWSNSRDEVCAKDIGLWVILTDKASLETGSIMKGLSALALMVQSKKSALPILILTTDKEVETSTLPSPLKQAQILDFKLASLPVKIVALLNTPKTNQDVGYRIDIHPLRELGLWIEVGPSKDATWSGVMLGVNGCEINFQTYGDVGNMPEHSTLEYPQQGLKINLAETEFTAWAIQNKMDSSKSYFARVDTLPDQILFGAYSNDEETDVYVIKF